MGLLDCRVRCGGAAARCRVGDAGPWDLGDGGDSIWRHARALQFEGEDAPVVAGTGASRKGVAGNDRFAAPRGRRHIEADGTARGQVDGVPLSAQLVVDGRRGYVISGDACCTLSFTIRPKPANVNSTDGELIAPMPGQILQVMVTVGAAVRRGQPLVIVEAMKMEHTILAPMDGVVEQICFGAGERVSEGVQLLKAQGIVRLLSAVRTDSRQANLTQLRAVDAPDAAPRVARACRDPSPHSAWEREPDDRYTVAARVSRPTSPRKLERSEKHQRGKIAQARRPFQSRGPR